MSREKVVEAARALLEQLGNSVPHADFEIEDLRAALRPGPAHALPESVREACHAATLAVADEHLAALRWIAAQSCRGDAYCASLGACITEKCETCYARAALGLPSKADAQAHERKVDASCRDPLCEQNEGYEHLHAQHPPAGGAVDVTRVVLVDHTTEMLGRVYDKSGVSVTTSVQDNGQTLKVFVDNPRRPA